MGEEVKTVKDEAKVEVPKKEEAPSAVPEAEKIEDVAAAEGGEKKKEEAAKEPPPPPPPCILGIDLHCTGCANKIKRCLLRCKGVERVEVNMVENQVVVKGIIDLQDICERLRKRTMRNATVISPPPPPTPAEADSATVLEGEPVVVHLQVSEVTTVELLVNMHCEACAQQLQKKILKMRGVQSADANSGTNKLTVTGIMPADRLVQYIHRRTGKLATVVPPPPPPEPAKEVEPKKEESEQNPEEPPTEGANNKVEQEKPPEENATDNKAAEGEKKDDGNAKPEDGSGKKEGSCDDEKAKPELLAVDGSFPPMMKRMMYWSYPHKHYYNRQVDEEDMMARRMSMVHPYAMSMMQWAPSPPLSRPPAPVASPPTMYQYYNYGMVERPSPAPQYFSDENPNACVIS